MVPFCNSRGEITTLQKISSNGFKQFQKGARKSGSYHRIAGAAGKEGSRVVLLAEGFATGKTLSAATGLPVYVCGDSGNLVAVASQLSKGREGKTYIVAGDTMIKMPNAIWAGKKRIKPPNC